MSGFHDPYAVLNIAPTDDLKVIRRAFIRESKLHHPDHGGDVERFRSVQLAYTALKARHYKPPAWTTIDVRVSLHDLLHGCVATVLSQINGQETVFEFAVPPYTYPGSFVKFLDKGSTTQRIRVRLLEITTQAYTRVESDVVIQRQINSIDARRGIDLEVVNFDGISHKVKISPETTASSLSYRISGEGFFNKNTKVRGDLHIIINVQG